MKRRRARGARAAVRLGRVLLLLSLLAIGACATTPRKKRPAHDSWWGPEADSQDKSFFYGSFFNDGGR